MTCKMHKIAERTVIPYLHKKGLAPKYFHTYMVATLGNCFWEEGVVEFNITGRSLEDGARTGRLSLA